MKRPLALLYMVSFLAAAPAQGYLHVSGESIVDGAGAVVQLRGMGL